jgi:hypothetical protein
MKYFRNVFLLMLACISLYFYSRFTVDDAFISWRYGANLVKAGLWDYNPSGIDPTQAYTNPIYAVLSIVPAYFGWDVVLFFKLVSTALMIAFVAWFCWVKQTSWAMILVFLAFPATVIHLYGGLETFMFVCLLAALCIALYENKAVQSVVLSTLLMFTRPEAWLLAVLVPVYFLQAQRDAGAQAVQANKLNTGRAAFAAAVLWGVLALYFLFHHVQFGDYLPNTFHVKHVGGFSLVSFLTFLFYCAPLLLIAAVLPVRLLVLLTVFFGAVVLNYSSSTLAMNYAGRFAFHVFAPVYLFAVYLSSRQKETVAMAIKKGDAIGVAISVKYASLINGALIIWMLVFGFAYDVGSLQFLTYYPRALNNHAALGKMIRDVSSKHGVRAFAIGDAGMAAYHSDLNVLDINGLGSALVARHGLTPDVLNRYQIDLIAFYANPSEKSVVSGKQDDLLRWAHEQKFVELCDVYWRKEYVFKMFARPSLPLPEVQALCDRSKALNDVSDGAMRAAAINVPPWQYWHE